MASCWLRAAKTVASKRALTVALAVTLAWPSLSGYPGAGGVAPASVSGGGSGGSGGSPVVEVVLPPAESAAATVVAGDMGAGFGARREAAASRTAFVGPWAQENNARPEGVMAAAVRTPLRVGKKSKVEAVERESPTVALRSLVNTVGANGREIAEEFGGHIHVRGRCSVVGWCVCVGCSSVLPCFSYECKSGGS